MSLTDLQIQATICPTSLRWPNSNIAFETLKLAVDELRALARGCDDACRTVEVDGDLTPEGVQRRIAQIGKQALTELAGLKEVQSAEKWVGLNIESLEKRMVDLPAAPASVIDAMQAREIRQHVRKQRSPIDFVMKSQDPRVLASVLTAPPFLSGLTDAELNVIRTRARQTLHPVQDDTIKALKSAIEELRKGVDATRRLLMQRCAVRQDADGEYRSIREPEPKVHLTA
jgi:hypothetical protein